MEKNSNGKHPRRTLALVTILALALIGAGTYLVYRFYLFMEQAPSPH